jgi:CspA family cold shock protein
MSKERVQGKVKMWRDEKGYGFLRPDAGGPDVFVHHSAIQVTGRGRKSLAEGERVEFYVEQGEKGPVAGHVVRLGV